MPTKDVILKVKSDTKQAEKGFQQIGMSIGKITSAIGIAFGGAQVISFLKDSVNAFMEEETALKKLSIAYGKNIDGLKRYASELQKQTAFGDEAIIEAESLVSAFIKEEQAIKDITLAAMNLSTAKGISLVSAADLLTKSIATETNALKRQGIEIEGAAGSAERLKSAIDGVNAAFGGQAAGALDTYAGKLANIENQIGDVQEEIGKHLMPVWLELNERLLNGVNNLKAGLSAVVDYYRTIGEFFGVLDKHDRFSGMMVSPHRENKNTGGTKGILDEIKSEDKTTESLKKELEIVGLANNLYGDYVEVLRQAVSAKRELFPPTELSGKATGGKPTIPIMDEQEVRTAFREFDIIANESARTLFNVFSEAWRNIFGEANSIFEQLLQNIGIGLMDAFAQDASTSIFNALIPGGSLFSGLFGGQANNGGGSVLVQIGESELTKATAKSVQSTYGEMQRRRIL